MAVIDEIRKGIDLNTKEGKELYELALKFKDENNTLGTSFLRSLLKDFQTKTGHKVDNPVHFKITDYKEGDESIDKCICGGSMKNINFVQFRYTSPEGERFMPRRDPIKVGDDHLKLVYYIDDKIGTGDLLKYESPNAKKKIRRKKKEDLQDTLEGLVNGSIIDSLEDMNLGEIMKSDLLRDYAMRIMEGDIEGLEFDLNPNNKKSMINYAVGNKESAPQKVRKVIEKYLRSHQELTQKEHALFTGWILENRKMKAESAGTVIDDGIYLMQKGDEHYDFDKELYKTLLTKKGREQWIKDNELVTLGKALNLEYLTAVEARSIEISLPGIKQRRVEHNREILEKYFDNWRNFEEQNNLISSEWKKQEEKWKEYLNIRDYRKNRGMAEPEKPELFMRKKLMQIGRFLRQTEKGDKGRWANFTERVSMRYSQKDASDFYTNVQKFKMAQGKNFLKAKQIMETNYVNGKDFESLQEVVDRCLHSIVRSDSKRSERDRARDAGTTYNAIQRFTEEYTEELKSAEFDLIHKSLEKRARKSYKVLKDYVSLEGLKEQLEWIEENKDDIEFYGEEYSSEFYVSPEHYRDLKRDTENVMRLYETVDFDDFRRKKKVVEDNVGKKVITASKYSSVIHITKSTRKNGNSFFLRPEEIERNADLVENSYNVKEVKKEIGYKIGKTYSYDARALGSLVNSATPNTLVHQDVVDKINKGYNRYLEGRGLSERVMNVVDEDSKELLEQQNNLYRVKGYGTKEAFSKKYGGIGMGFNPDTKEWGYSKIGRDKLISRLEDLAKVNEEKGLDAKVELKII